MFIENISPNEVVSLKEQISYEVGKVVHKTLVGRKEMTLTLFAFDEGTKIDTHSSNGDAMVVVLEGEVQLTVGGVAKKAKEGETLLMPANIPHAVEALTKYKMLLIVVKPLQ